jgi:hypothetical protein
MAEEREEEPTSPAVTEDQIFVEETPVTVSQEQNFQEENLQEQDKKIEESHGKNRTNTKKQKRRRTITFLSQISKQVEKNGNQIGRITTIIQSLHKRRQTTIAPRLGLGQSQLQTIKQVKSQLGQLQKQVSLLQKDIQKLRTASTRKTGFKKLSSSTSTATTTVKPKSRMNKKNKKNKAIASTKLKRRRTNKR